MPVKQRRAAMQRQPSAAKAAEPANGGAMPPPPPRINGTTHSAASTVPQYGVSERGKGSLLKSNAAALRNQPHKSAAEKTFEEEKEMMEAMLKKQALRSVQENATGRVYQDPINTGWTPPSW